MGEIADMLVDQMWDELDSPDYDWEDDDFAGKCCKFCGCGGLHWAFREGKGWRLASPEGYHVCKSGRFAGRVEKG